MGEGHVPIEAARLLADDQVPPLGLDAFPHLVNAGSVQQFAADLRLSDDLDDQLVELDVAGQIVGQESPAVGDLILGARLPLFLSGVAGLDQSLGRPTECHLDGLSEAHHRAPPLRPLERLVFLVPDFAPGGFPFSGFSRAIPRLFDPCRGY